MSVCVCVIFIPNLFCYPGTFAIHSSPSITHPKQAMHTTLVPLLPHKIDCAQQTYSRLQQQQQKASIDFFSLGKDAEGNFFSTHIRRQNV